MQKKMTNYVEIFGGGGGGRMQKKNVDYAEKTLDYGEI